MKDGKREGGNVWNKEAANWRKQLTAESQEGIKKA
jgi:hypothetical protein